MWFAVRLLVCGTLLWQAIAGLTIAVGYAASGSNASVGTRLLAGTDERIRRALGEDAAVLFALRDAAPAGTLLLTQKIMGEVADYRPEELVLLARKNGLIDQLMVLLYPEPWVFPVPDPIALVEQELRAGRATALLWLPGDRRPAAAGWHALHQTASFEIWGYRTD